MTFLSAPPSSTPITSVDGVEAEGLRGELGLDAGGDGRIVKSDGDGGGLALRDFQGEAGAAEGADGKFDPRLTRGIGSQAIGDDLGHAQVRVVFNALGGADDDLAGMNERPQTGQCGAEKLRWHDGDEDLSIADGLTAAGDHNLSG